MAGFGHALFRSHGCLKWRLIGITERTHEMVVIGFAMVCYLALIGSLILLVRWEAQISRQRRKGDTALAALRVQARQS